VSRAEPSIVATRLRALTPARVGLGRTGASQLTRDLLDFQRAHAQARDAVHARMDAGALASTIGAVFAGDVVRLHSAATDRATYLQRPDLGRRLDAASKSILVELAGQPVAWEVAVIVADGLSALAVERHAVPLLEGLLPRMDGWRVAPICVVEQGRVAIGDEIGAALRALLSVVLIGERPGLSSPDSLGAYVTWEPRPGRTDAERNCISNIRSEGLTYESAATQLAALLRAARVQRLTGVELKQDRTLAERL
jgi:ethanolamine ammonia-lyase small subunit